jgi:DNA-binding CsgD family transcriptional regulator
MADTDRVAVEVVSVPTIDGAGTHTTSRRELRDLAVLLALPAMWIDLEPAGIAAGLLDALFGIFRLDSGYVRFSDPDGGPALEYWRPRGPRLPIELEIALSAAPTRGQGAVTMAVAMPTGGGSARVTSVSSSFPGEDGLAMVGSSRSDFPTDFELHLLRAAVGQATISIHAARRLAVERAARVAAEAALHRRNVFLASIADELKGPLATLEEHARQARSLATELSAPPGRSDTATDTVVNAREGPAPQDGGPSLAPPARLTQREAEVLGLLAQGLSNKEIAAILSLSDRTVERHVTGLYRKIGVERRTEATAFALRYGLIDANLHET